MSIRKRKYNKYDYPWSKRFVNKGEFTTGFFILTAIVLMLFGFLLFNPQSPLSIFADQEVNVDYTVPIEGIVFEEESSSSYTDDKSLFSNYTYNYYKINDTDFYVNASWNKLINFSVSINFETNLSIDSNLYNDTCYGIWDFTTNSWDYSASIQITGNYTHTFNYFNNKFLNRSNTSNTTIRILFRCSNEENNFNFNYNIVVNGYWWFGLPPYNITEFEVASLQSSTFTEEESMNHLYAHYHLNQNSGTNVPDSSGNGRDGTAYNIEDGDWKSAKLGNGIELDGVNEYINCGNIGNWERNDTFSVEFWVETITTGDFIVARGISTRGWAVYMSGSGTVFVYLRHDNSMTISRYSGSAINDGAWHHVAITYSGNSSGTGIDIYIDGSLDNGASTGTLTDTIISGSGLYIGARTGGTCFVGTIDEVVLYDDVIDSFYVSERYNSGSGTETIPANIFTKNNQSTFRFLRDYEQLINFTVNVDFSTNITIDSNLYLNNCLRIWDYSTSSWDSMSLDTITGNYTNTFNFTSQDYLSKSSYDYCDVKVGIFVSNEEDEYSFDLFLNVSGYWTETIYPTTEFREDDIVWSNQTIDVSILTDREYYKNYTYTIRYNVDWNSVSFLVLNIGISLNRTINSTAYIGEGFSIWSFTEQEWIYTPSIYNYPYTYTYSYPERTITNNCTYYYELYPAKTFFYKLGDGYTFIKVRFSTSNLDYDYSILFDIDTSVSEYNFNL